MLQSTVASPESLAALTGGLRSSEHSPTVCLVGLWLRLLWRTFCIAYVGSPGRLSKHFGLQICRKNLSENVKKFFQTSGSSSLDLQQQQQQRQQLTQVSTARRVTIKMKVRRMKKAASSTGWALGRL